MKSRTGWTGADALASSAFRRFFVGQAASSFGDALVPVALAFAVIETGGSGRDLGIVLAAAAVPNVLLVLIGGVIGDRWPRQRVMLFADVARATIQATTALALATGHAHVLTLALLQAAWGTAAAIFRPASSSIVPELVDAAALRAANSLLAFSQSTTTVVAPIASGALVVLAGPSVCFAIDSGTFVISAVALAGLRTRRSVVAAAQPIVVQLKSGWREFAARSWLWLTVAYVSLFYAAVVAPFLVLGPFVMTAQFGGARDWAAVVAAYGCGAVAGSLAGLKIGRSRTLMIACGGLSLFAAPAALLALYAPLPMIVAASVIGGVGIGVFNALYITVLQQQVPQEIMSRVVAYDWLGSVAALPLGLVAAGALAPLVGPRIELAVAAVVASLALAVCALPVIRKVGTAVGKSASAGTAALDPVLDRNTPKAPRPPAERTGGTLLKSHRE